MPAAQAFVPLYHDPPSVEGVHGLDGEDWFWDVSFDEEAWRVFFLFLFHGRKLPNDGMAHDGMTQRISPQISLPRLVSYQTLPRLGAKVLNVVTV